MVRRRSRVLGGVVALILVGAFAGGVAAAGAGFSANGSLGAGQKAVSSPCTSMSAKMLPTYDTGGFYKIDGVEVTLACPVGTYTVLVSLATGADTYVERSASVSFLAAGSQVATVSFPSVKVADVTNIAALVVPGS